MSGARLAVLALVAAACSGPPDYRLSHARALEGFRESSPLVDELTRGAAAVAVFVDIQGTADGCAHRGVLLLPDDVREEVVLRCLEEPRAPGGYQYHQLVLLRHAGQVDELRGGALDLGEFAHVDAHDPGDARLAEGEAPGWVVCTRRSQLLFGDQTVRQRLEPAR